MRLLCAQVPEISSASLDDAPPPDLRKKDDLGEAAMKPANEALIVIDVQNDFCPGGALAVAGGDEIISRINGLMSDFATVVLTQDWHPANHASFAANHPGAEPFSLTEMPYGPQVLWPNHCVQGTRGAEFHATLSTDPAQLVVRKGFRPGIDSYSAFFENDQTTSTGLEGYLRSRGVTAVTLVGLATDYCVAYSALDAARLGFTATVPEGATRAIDLNGSLVEARAKMRAAGVTLET
jgi:nicotinamidase/pyrazinamidase